MTQNQTGTLRSAAAARGIKAITVEIGNPQLFQNQYIQVTKRNKVLSTVINDSFNSGPIWVSCVSWIISICFPWIMPSPKMKEVVVLQTLCFVPKAFGYDDIIS